MACSRRSRALSLLVSMVAVLMAGCVSVPDPAPVADVLVVDPVMVPFAERFSGGAYTVGLLTDPAQAAGAELVVVDTARDRDLARGLLAERRYGALPWVLDIAEEVPPAERPDGGRDPAHWTDPIRSVDLVTNMMWGFITIDPDRRSSYEAVAADVEQGLLGLHETFLAATEQCATRHLLATEARYGHWVHRYNLYQHGTQGRDEEELRALVERLDIPTLFHAPGDEAEAARLGALLDLEVRTIVFPGEPGAAVGVSGHFATLATAADTLRDGLRC